jgi:hypothetical protein|nr:MAG TPA: hypothetical protein [Caudoviricetes sp.]
MLTEGDLYWMINKFKEHIPKIREIVSSNTEYNLVKSINLRVFNKERVTTLIPHTGKYTYHSVVDILENYDRDIAKDVLNLWDLFMNSYVVIDKIHLNDITLDFSVLFDKNKIVLTIDHIVQLEKELKR